MDQRVVGDAFRRGGEETRGSCGDLVGGFMLQPANVLNSGENGNGDVEVRVDELESCTVEVEGDAEEVINEETSEEKRMRETSGQAHLIDGASNSVDTIENSNNLDNGVSRAIVIISEDASPLSGGNEELEAKFRNATAGKSKKIVSEVERSCVIDVKPVDGGKLCDNWDGERVCRICHLSSEQPPETSTSGNVNTDLINLGCGCKDELGIAHISCAEVWFKLKGNSLCEICGETATNITGIGDNGFMEEWNEGRFVGSSGDSSNAVGGCWRGQPFCNFLMACLVIAFVLPWFFRVNMF